MGRRPTHVGRLGRWIEQAGRSRQSVADELGISRKFLDHLCREYRRPGTELAARIQRLTRGKVSTRYLLTLPKHDRR